MQRMSGFSNVVLHTKVSALGKTAFDDRKVYRCKVAAVGAGWTSISVLFPSPSWKTSSGSVQTYTKGVSGENMNPSLEFKVYTFYLHWSTVTFCHFFLNIKAPLFH